MGITPASMEERTLRASREVDAEPAMLPTFVPGATLRAVMYGDSTEAGEPSRRGTNPSREAQKVLDHFRLDYRVWEEAFGGSTAEDLLNGTDRRNPSPFRQRIRVVEADIVSFRFGINDVHRSTPERFRTALTTLVKLSHRAGKVVILQTPGPVAHEKFVEGVRRNASIVREVAASHPGVVLCDQHDWGHRAKETGTTDGVHPTNGAFVFQGQREALCIVQATKQLNVRELSQ